jgi:hypothetical protein
MTRRHEMTQNYFVAPDPLDRVASKHRSILGNQRQQQIAPKDSSRASTALSSARIFIPMRITRPPLKNLIHRNRLSSPYHLATMKFRSTQNYVETYPVSISFPVMRRFAAVRFSRPHAASSPRSQSICSGKTTYSIVPKGPLARQERIHPWRPSARLT